MQKKLFIRIGIIVAIVSIVSFSDWSFAAEENEDIKSLAYIINFLTEILSWIWVIFAKFAGEFLTNKRVYGEVLGLDSLLWQYWVVVRNFANFGLGAFFTYIILTAIFKKEDISGKIKNTFLRLLIAGIGIQVSWFFTAVVLDASTITLVAVGSFPSQSISKNSALETEFETSLAKYLGDEFVLTGEELVLFPKSSRASNYLQATSIPIKKDSQITKKQFFDDLLPKYDDVSGPLYYMGISILDSFKGVHVKDTGEKGLKTTILNTIINGGATIVFAIEMAVLCVIALLRIFYLWMFITLSPFVVLLYCIKKADGEGGGKLIDKYLKSFTDNLNLKSFFLNAFKPTIIVLGISLSIIFVAAIKGVILTGEDLNLQGVTISSSCPNTESNQTSCQTRVDSPLFGGVFKNLSKTFMDIIISIITIILVYQIIKFSVGLGKGTDFISKKAEKLQDNIGDLITSTPIIPVTGYDEKGLPTTNHISLGTAFGIGGKSTITEQKLDTITKKFGDKSRDQTEELMKARGLSDSNTLTEREKSDIQSAGKNDPGLIALKAKKDIIDGIKTSEGKGMTLGQNPGDGGFWKEKFGNWLSSQKDGIKDYAGIKQEHREGWDSMVKIWNDEANKDLTLDQKYAKIFENRKAVLAYSDFFGLGGIQSWDALKNADISQGSTTGESNGEESTGNNGGTSGNNGSGKETNEGGLKETLSSADFSAAFTGKEQIKQSDDRNNCYLVAAVNLIARHPRFETLMKSSIKKDGNNYIIRLPLGEPDGTEYTVTPAELRKATIKGGGDGYRVMEIGYMKRMLNKTTIDEADFDRMSGGSTIFAMNNFLGSEGFDGKLVTSGGDMKKPLSTIGDAQKTEVVNHLLNYDIGNGKKALSASSLPGSDANYYNVGSNRLYNSHAYPILKVTSQGNKISGITVLDPMNTKGRGEITLTEDEFFKAFCILDVGTYTSSFLNSTTDKSQTGTIDTKER